MITQRESSRRGKALPMLEILEEALRESRLDGGRRARAVRARRAARRAAAARGRLRGALPPHLHLGHDRQAERRRARAGRLPRLDRARGRPTRRTCTRATSCTSPPTWAGSWGRGPSSASARSAARSSSPRARPTGRRPTGSGGRSSRSASRRSASRRRSRERCCRTATRRATSRRCARSSRPGEPWNPEPYRWLFENVGGSRVPVINCTGGTEVGACFLSPTPVAPIKACSVGGPALGMAMDVVDDDGNSLVGTGEVGELVCRKPFPGMTRGFWRDPEKYLETYWSRFPGVWVHGDWASVDADGFWFLHGRSDDTMNIAGKRVGPAELESAAVGHPGRARGSRDRRAARGEGRDRVDLLLPAAGRGSNRGGGGRVTSQPSSARRSSPTASSSSTRCRRRARRRSCVAP